MTPREAIARRMAVAIEDYFANQDYQKLRGRDATDAALTALREAGYVILPKEPTEAMLAASWQFVRSNGAGFYPKNRRRGKETVEEYQRRKHYEKMGDRYRAMIAAHEDEG